MIVSAIGGTVLCPKRLRLWTVLQMVFRTEHLCETHRDTWSNSRCAMSKKEFSINHSRKLRRLLQSLSLPYTLNVDIPICSPPYQNSCDYRTWDCVTLVLVRWTGRLENKSTREELEAVKSKPSPMTGISLQTVSTKPAVYAAYSIHKKIKFKYLNYSFPAQSLATCCEHAETTGKWPRIYIEGHTEFVLQSNMLVVPFVSWGTIRNPSRIK